MGLAIAGGVVLLGSLAMGSVAVPVADLVQALWGQGDELTHTILWELRLPRTLLAALVGAALGLSGALVQGLLRNGLADPYLLGISAGAGLVAVVFLGFGLAFTWLPLAAWVGALATATLVFGLARSATGLSVTRLILAGVAVGSFFGSVTSMLLLFADDRVQLALNWLAGSLNGRSWREVQAVSGYIGLGLILGCGLGRPLNLLSLGEEMARSLGVAIGRTRLTIGAIAALLAASAASTVGLIGFVGLLVPHVTRLLVGTDYRWVLPVSAAMGAILLVAADTAARSGPVELPVGVVTALVGAPFFGWLLWRRTP
ncbi:MAG TPA: iron ABC transporter [Cyanobacteria bacterium UBA8156]|nr:iron ABC transporter [Cyanobacteria bacterium UBA8156]